MNGSIQAGHDRSRGRLALLVDRDDDTRHMYAEYLKIEAWQVAEASDGREALAKAIAIRPDVVVTETRLPGISGYDLCDLLRRDVDTRCIPIVVVTGDAYATDVEHARTAGADAVLVKPCLPQLLLAEIRRMLENSTALRQRSEALRAEIPGRLARADRALNRSRLVMRKYSLKRAHRRGNTISPPAAPPTLLCPACDRRLTYQRSHVGGVSSKHAEQWDYFECTNGCGSFQYRTRTRKLRKIA